MSKTKLVVCIMGQTCMRYLPMCLDAVKSADAIVYCDGGSTDNSIKHFTKFCVDNEYFDGTIIENTYDQENKQMNGLQRTFYLNHLKKHYLNSWVLCLDADEIVEDLSKIKEWIESIELSYQGNTTRLKPQLVSVKMRHLIGDLASEDATIETHYVMRRLFQVTEDLFYPLQEHPVLQSKDTEKNKQKIGMNDTVIWHLAYIPGMWEIKRRYESHVKKSTIHSQEFLRSWYKAHLFGNYPQRRFNPVELPQQLLDEFGLDRDELYFEGRNKLEAKHWLDSVHWKEFFGLSNAIEFGCGLGPRVYTLNKLGVDCKGIEISKWAVDRSMVLDKICLGDVTNVVESLTKYDLVIAYDLLEHIDQDKLADAITNLKNHAKKWILVSVPVIGDPNLLNDPTHKIHKPRSWWVRQFTSQGLKEVEVPSHFAYRHQLQLYTVGANK